MELLISGIEIYNCVSLVHSGGVDRDVTFLSPNEDHRWLQTNWFLLVRHLQAPFANTTTHNYQ